MTVELGPDGKPVVPDHVLSAVRTLIEWTGDDPTREGLLDTPKRVARAWLEYCQGYAEDPAIHLSRTFEEVGGYDEIVMLRDIPFQSHCEHHMAPITGKASIAYLPRDRVVGISKLARVLNGFARRLQVQERLTQQVLADRRQERLGHHLVGLGRRELLAEEAVALVDREAHAQAGQALDGAVHGELVEHLEGTSTVVDVLAAMHKRHGVPVWLDPRSEAGGESWFGLA